ncbi:hypothetical protein GS429_03330 [Natronorubrum sp. JWXQ-INN-674]|uniref:HNH nuclease domain-containing protein n=1 Tax=Natronorubrum halalkaliphilum TaxID=2691917 RepID=A0A6B0VJG8_9EURY|nr:hypothetical protein [Natronorubrum halalkaliphilum]
MKSDAVWRFNGADVPSPDGLDEVQAQRTQIRAELADAKPEIKQKRDRLRRRLVEDARGLLTHLSTEEDTKKAQIISLKETLESDLRGDLIADVVGCSSGYPGKFRWQKETGTVVLRADVERRRMNRFSASQKANIHRRDNHQCVNCESDSKLQVHHIIPVDAGGDNEMQNGATLCDTCHGTLHRWKHGFGEDYTTISEFWTWTER